MNPRRGFGTIPIDALHIDAGWIDDLFFHYLMDLEAWFHILFQFLTSLIMPKFMDYLLLLLLLLLPPPPLAFIKSHPYSGSMKWILLKQDSFFFFFFFFFFLQLYIYKITYFFWFHDMIFFFHEMNVTEM